MTFYMYQKRPVFQARTYTGQWGEGSLESIVSWLSGMFPGAGYVEATESYDSSIDQMVMHLKVGDTGPVNEYTPVMDVIVGEILVTGPGGGVSKITYNQLLKQFDIID